ncbi:MAG: SDR family oxidoreductase [Bacteroidales bacterium]|nr:SDR family oxidoreductase [Bacteroidales bacterium]
MKRLENKVAVITGGNSGMGLATAQLFIKEGAKVFVNARNEQRLQETSYLEEENIRVIRADVTKKEELQNLFKTVYEESGKIDIVFANAGGGKMRPLEMVDDDHIDSTFDTNVKGVINTVQSALPFFNEGAKIILNTSVSNVKGMPGLSVYAATKAAVRSLARSFTAELLPRGIRVNAISPGPIETPIFTKMDLTEEQQQQFASNVVASVPMGRSGKTEEIANAVLFLASDESSYISGVELAIDGGMVQV